MNGSHNPIATIGDSFCLCKVKCLQAVEVLKLKYDLKKEGRETSSASYLFQINPVNPRPPHIPSKRAFSDGFDPETLHLPGCIS